LSSKKDKEKEKNNTEMMVKREKIRKLKNMKRKKKIMIK